jgi:hypothetical protein
MLFPARSSTRVDFDRVRRGRGSNGSRASWSAPSIVREYEWADRRTGDRANRQKPWESDVSEKTIIWSKSVKNKAVATEYTDEHGAALSVGRLLRQPCRSVHSVATAVAVVHAKRGNSLCRAALAAG